MRASRVVGFVLAVVMGACSGGGAAPSSIPARSCALTVWYRPLSDVAHVEVIGSWDGWSRPGRVLERVRDDGWRASQWDLAPGDYAYGIVEDGTWIADPDVPTSTFHEGHEVAWTRVGDCDVPALQIASASGSATGAATVEATFFATRAKDPIDPTSISVTTPDGAPVPAAPRAEPSTGSVHLAFDSLAPGKHALLVHAKDATGKDAEPARATVWIEARPFDPRDTAIYQVIVDRYRAADGSALAPPALASGRAGGQLEGVRRAIESGEIESMGFNTIWLSPLYANPTGTFPGADGRPYSSYHGYWPIAARSVEPAIGDEAAVDALVAAAHARGVRVLFDVVPNHVHEQHPYFADHAKDGWFDHTDRSCICGSATCDWGTHIQDCWFAPYLPDFDWHEQAVADTVSGDVLWWMDRFGADGVRIDAVPMMPRAATRRIVWEIRRRFDHLGNRSFLLGENFTGPGGWDLIRYQLGPWGLDSEFDFPLLWALRGAVAGNDQTLADVDAAIRTGEEAWLGSGAVMGRTIGNHDVPRFASVASGDDQGDGWDPAPQAADPAVYAKQRLALGIVFALPGAPVVYYGDEIALAGRGDPDSRRVMPAEAAWTPDMTATRDFVKALGRARACSAALRRGAYRSISADAEHLVFAREDAESGERALVVVQRMPVARFATPLPGIADGDWSDALGGPPVHVAGAQATLDPRPLTIGLYFPAGSACATP